MLRHQQIDRVIQSTSHIQSIQKSMIVIEKIVMIPIRLENDQSIHRQNRVIIVENEIAVTRRQAENIKNHHENVARAAAVIVVATHVTQIDHESDGNAPHPMMIAQVNRARAATNVINIQEKKITREVIATNEAVTE